MRRLVLLFLLLPWVVLAQTPPPDAPVAAPPLVPAPEEAEPLAPAPALDDAPRGMPPAPRILLESLSGGVGTLAGGLLGILLTVSVSSCSFFEGDCSALIPMSLSGMALGAASGTYLAGRLMKGRGGFLGTLAGATLGTGAGLALLLADISNRGDDAAGIVALLALPGIGATVGYEASRLLQGPADLSLTVTPPSGALVPVIGPTPGGGLMGGLSGRF